MENSLRMDLSVSQVVTENEACNGWANSAVVLDPDA